KINRMFAQPVLALKLLSLAQVKKMKYVFYIGEYMPLRMTDGGQSKSRKFKLDFSQVKCAQPQIPDEVGRAVFIVWMNLCYYVLTSFLAFQYVVSSGQQLFN